jgi:transcriptional regulator with XRE-family HTH domain
MMQFPIINLTATGRNIKMIRIDHNISVKELQELFGFSTPQAIYKWQKGICLPTLENLLVLSKVFGVSIEEIIVLCD